MGQFSAAHRRTNEVEVTPRDNNPGIDVIYVQFAWNFLHILTDKTELIFNFSH